jgi:hypothetical protein
MGPSIFFVEASLNDFECLRLPQAGCEEAVAKCSSGVDSCAADKAGDEAREEAHEVHGPLQ